MFQKEETAVETQRLTAQEIFDAATENARSELRRSWRSLAVSGFAGGITLGLTGIGEGGSKDMLEQCAGSLIGQDPFRSEMLWGQMFKGWFYPPGREKIHAQGALDLALWDLKGKAFQAPVHQLLGGMMRNHLECYGTGPLRETATPGQRMTMRDRAKAGGRRSSRTAFTRWGSSRSLLAGSNSSRRTRFIRWCWCWMSAGMFSLPCACGRWCSVPT